MQPLIEIYTTALCPYCVAAKNFLSARGHTYQEIRIDLDPARREEMLRRAAQRRTVPQIFINGRHVGGYDDMMALVHAGALAQWLQPTSPGAGDETQ